MKINDLLNNKSFEIYFYNGTNTVINNIVCSDLHSYALNKLNKNDIWITITAHMNTLAVAKLKNIACIILADGVKPPQDILKAAEEHKITILSSGYPVYETAIMVNNIMNGKSVGEGER